MKEQLKKREDMYKAMSKEMHRMHTNHICLFGNTGTGKSLYFHHLATKGLQKVIFLCKSYLQAKEKAASFASSNLRVQLVKSKTQKAKESNMNLSFIDKKTSPFAFGAIDKASLDDEEKEAYNSIDRDDFDFAEAQVIVTVFSNISAIRGIDLSEWHVVFDDVEYADIRPLIKYEPKDWKIQPVLEWAKINGKDVCFATRPADLFLTYNLLANKIYFTTAELHVRKVLESKYFCESVDLSHPEENHDITILSTTMTRRKKQDSLISVFHEMQVQQGMDTWALIGDGIGSELTFSGMKGVNSLAEMNLLIELSVENQVVIEEMYCMFSPNKMTADKTVFKKTCDQLNRIVMIDKFHQATGRNQGNRFNGKKVLVMIDKYFAKSIASMTNYKDVPVLSDIDFKSRAMVISHMGKDDFLLELSAFLYDKAGYMFANKTAFLKLAKSGIKLPVARFKADLEKLFNEQKELAGASENIHFKIANFLSEICLKISN